jgi:serine/threonine protein kinase/tetratricopeptide (TPR) repeat protein
MDCPSPSQLEALATSATSPEMQALRDHVQHCERCLAISLESNGVGFDDTVAPLPVFNARPPRRKSSPASSPLVAAPNRAPSLEPGTRIGRYVILQKLGEGAMGEVYIAHDPELDRKVAVKILSASHAEAEDAASRVRLLREAQALAQLSHPSVVAVHDVGTYDGRVFLAMEFIDGITLEEWLKEGKRSWREIVQVLAAAGHGLAGAHAKNIIHRDFKPANVLIARDGRVRVLDFGLARSSDSSEPPPADIEDTPSGRSWLYSELSRAGSISGTPKYMSPEQLKGRSDARSDQFSFCFVLYEALFGEPPFQMLDRSHPPSVPKNTKVPRWLSRTVVKGLAANPSARHADMNELLSLLEPDVRWRRPLEAAAAVVVAALAVTAVGAFSMRSRPACTDARSKLVGVWDAQTRAQVRAAFDATKMPYASKAWAAVEGDLERYASAWTELNLKACEAYRVRGDETEVIFALRVGCLEVRKRELGSLVQLFARADAQTVARAPEATRRLSDLDMCADLTRLTRTPAPQSRAQADQAQAIRLQLADAHAHELAGRPKEGVQIARAGLLAAESLRMRPLLAEALETSGWLSSEAADFKGAAELLSAAYFEADASGDDETAALAATRLAWVTSERLADPAAGAQWIRHAGTKLERILQRPLAELGLGIDDARHRDLVALFLNNRAMVELQQGQRDRALGSLNASLAQLRGDSKLLTADVVLNNLGMALQSMQRHEEAHAFYVRALESMKRRLGSEHPWLGITVYNLGESLALQTRYREALEQFKEAARRFDTSFGPVSAYSALAREQLGRSLLPLGDAPGAIAAYREALAIRQKVGEGTQAQAPLYVLIGHAQLAAGAPDEAKVSLEKAMSLGLAKDEDKARASLDLASVLWADRRERCRAQQLVQRWSGTAHEEVRREVEDWLAAHPAQPSCAGVRTK